MPPERTETAEGHELALATHVLGPHLLTAAARCEPDAGDLGRPRAACTRQKLRVDDLEYRSRRVQRHHGLRAHEADAGRARRAVGARAASSRGRHACTRAGSTRPGSPTRCRSSSASRGRSCAPTQQGADTFVWLAAADVPEHGRFWHDRRPRPDALPALHARIAGRAPRAVGLRGGIRRRLLECSGLMSVDKLQVSRRTGSAQMREEAERKEREALNEDLLPRPRSPTRPARRSAAVSRDARPRAQLRPNMRERPPAGEVRGAGDLAAGDRAAAPAAGARDRRQQVPYEPVAGARRLAAMRLVRRGRGPPPHVGAGRCAVGMTRREALTLQFAENFHQRKPEPDHVRARRAPDHDRGSRS